jgi:hypothetical protein
MIRSEKKPLIGAGIIAATGALVIFAGVTALKNVFGYPDIIRAEPGVIMERLATTVHITPYLYYFGVGGAGICMFLFSILFGRILAREGEDIFSALGRGSGMVAGVLLYAGIIRYSILFPRLSELRGSGIYDDKTIDLVFYSLNSYIGDSLAEHAQFTFTAIMILCFGISILRTKVINRWVAVFGFITVPVIIIGNLEQFGVKAAFAFNRSGAKMLAIWLLFAGISLIIKGVKTKATAKQ